MDSVGGEILRFAQNDIAEQFFSNLLKCKDNKMITNGLARTFSSRQIGWATKPQGAPELEAKMACPAHKR